jgi:hypothetical protein
MAVDHIRYDLLAQDALRGVVRNVLTDAAKKGLPGEHHFYISFDTRAEGVQISPRLLAQYPEEMTIILQHQFWDLTVSDERFQVGLSFSGIPERLVVPFAAVKGFFDPSVQFGLQFEQITEEKPATGQGQAPAATVTRPASVPAAPDKPRPAPSTIAMPEPANPPKAEPEIDKPSGGADVVRLDRFRKK